MSEESPIYSSRSELRITHLKHRTPDRTTVMNVRVPRSLDAELRQIALDLHISKTELVIAMLQDAVETARRLRAKVALNSPPRA